MEMKKFFRKWTNPEMIAWTLVLVRMRAVGWNKLRWIGKLLIRYRLELDTLFAVAEGPYS